MAASANSSGNQPDHSSFNGVTGISNPSNGNSGAVPDNSATVSGLKHNPGISTDWSAEEQQILEDGLIEFASDTPVNRYSKIAMNLQDKTVRDVALRCRWMNIQSPPYNENKRSFSTNPYPPVLQDSKRSFPFQRKEVSKRRKEDPSRKSKDKKEKISDPSTKTSYLPNETGSQPYALSSAVTLDNDDGISYKAIGGITGELLEQNAQAFQQISANFSSFQIHNNIHLFCQARDNIIKVMNSLNDSPEIMKQMPPLPVKLNEELANSVLPH